MKELINRLAQLGKLGFSEKETEEMSKDFKEILSVMQKVCEFKEDADVDGTICDMREDVAKDSEFTIKNPEVARVIS